MYITGGNNPNQMRRKGVNYIPDVNAAISEGWIAQPLDTEEYHKQCLCNHNTPAEHFHFWRILKEKLYK